MLLIKLKFYTFFSQYNSFYEFLVIFHSTEVKSLQIYGMESEL